jgi:ferredoxin
MAHVVCQPCDNCRYTDCVVPCPVECFYGDELRLYIHPDECIDCEACVGECPVKAIFAETDVPPDQNSWIGINADRTRAGGLENITTLREPLGPPITRD